MSVEVDYEYAVLTPTGVEYCEDEARAQECLMRWYNREPEAYVARRLLGEWEPVTADG